MSDAGNKVIVVMVTVGAESEGRNIASALINQNLAACVNMFPIQSTYRWQGEIQVDQEWQLIVKTAVGNFDDIEMLVRSLHSYELPEIIALPVVQGYAPYISWVRDCSTPNT